MSRLSRADLTTVLDFTRRLYTITEAARLPAWVCRELPRLVGADHVTWNDMALSVPWTEVHEHPRLQGFDDRCGIFARHLFEHPGLQHFLATGDPGPVKISDFLNARQFHRLPIYDALYRDLRYEDQFGMCLESPGPRTRAVALARDRHNFQERDRAMLQVVRPHLARALDNAEILRRARAGRAPLEEPVSQARRPVLAYVDERGRLRPPMHQARELLQRIMVHNRRAPCDALPEPLAQWYRAARRRKLPAPTFVHHCGERCLIARLIAGPDPSGETAMLVLEERTSPRAARRLRCQGLSRREIEVLCQLEQGKTNREIAAALFISPATVKKHLEHIFGKLGVNNRTAAVAALRRQRR